MEGEKPFEVKKWNAVAQWKAVPLWQRDCVCDKCAICKNVYLEPCIECDANKDTNSQNKCNIAWGTCNHCFHFHCISRWLKLRNTCPHCAREWELK